MRWLLLTGLLLTGCGRDPSGGRIDPQLAAYLPADTILVAGLRTAPLRASPLWDTRLDLRAGTVQEILAAVTPSAWVVLVRGEPGVVPEEWPLERLRGDVMAFGMSVSRTEMSPAVRQILEATTHIPERAAGWMTFLPGEARTLGVPGGQSGNTRRFMNAVSATRGWALVGSDLEISIRAATRNALEAEELAGTLRGLATLARATVHPRVQPLLDHMEIAALDAEVSVRVSAPADSVHEWLR